MGWLSLWAMTGVVVYFWGYQKLSNPSYEDLQNRLLWMKVRSEEPKAFIERLPEIFAKYPTVGAALYFNSRMNLIGSSYDGERFAERSYNALVEHYKGKGKLGEETKKRLMSFSMPDQSRVILYADERQEALALIHFYLNKHPAMNWLIILYFFTGLVIFLMYLVSLESRSSDGAPRRDRRGRQEIDPSLYPNRYNLGAGDPWTKINEEFHFSEKAIALLDAIEREFPVRGVAYYSLEDGQWCGVVQKMGGITIRGSSVPVLSPALIEAAKHRSSVVLEEGRSVLIPLKHRGHLVGAIFTRFSQPNHCAPEDEKKLAAICGDFAQSVFLQRIYDLAIIDTDTEFHTYPYFHFLIKEKLKTQSHFVTIVFEFSGINKVTPVALRGWARLVRGELGGAGFEPELYARIDRGKFALVYDTNTRGGEREVYLNKLERVPSILRKCTDAKIKGAGELLGGFFLRPAEMDDAGSYFKRLEYLMIHSKMGGEGFRLPENEMRSPEPVFPEAG